MVRNERDLFVLLMLPLSLPSHVSLCFDVRVSFQMGGWSEVTVRPGRNGMVVRLICGKKEPQYFLIWQILQKIIVLSFLCLTQRFRILTSASNLRYCDLTAFFVELLRLVC